ncbi:MAG: hypothetical protein V4539_10350 [Bacteroidota bacterium]
MNISTSHLPSFCKALEDALATYKDWVGFDERIQQLSSYDLHFFEHTYHASDFQLFNHNQDRDVIILPVEALLGFVKDTARDLLMEGKQFSHIEFDDIKVLEHNAEMKFYKMVDKVGELLDEHDWTKVTYDPSIRSTGMQSFEELVVQNKIEYAIDRLTSLSLSSNRGMPEAIELAHRYWDGTPLEPHIEKIITGSYLKEKQELLFNHKNDVMNAENLDYLQNQLKYLGFGEGLQVQLEKQLQEGLPDFQLKASHEFGKDQMDATLHFKKSEREGKEMYFFNKYDATLKQGERNLSQTFYINNKGQSITFKESCNLLNGRAVFKELAPKEGEKYKAWVKLDTSERDPNGNAKMKHFHENFGYDVKEALGRVPLKELSDPDKMQSLVASLEKGNLATVTLLKDGAEKSVQITADPQFKTLKMYDMEGKKLYVPAEKQDQRYGQAPVDEKRMDNGIKANIGEELGGKKVDLLPVNSDVSQGMGQKIG